MIAMQKVSGLPALRARPAVATRPTRQAMVCKASYDAEKTIATLAVPVATVVAAGMLVSAVVPEQALAARSGGRAGGSNFAARRAAPRAQPRVTNNYSTTVVAAPPVYAASPFGYGGFGFGGFRLMPTFVMPFPFFGGLFQFMFLALMFSVVFGVVKGMLGGSSKRSQAKNDDWDKL